VVVVEMAGDHDLDARNAELPLQSVQCVKKGTFAIGPRQGQRAHGSRVVVPVVNGEAVPLSLMMNHEALFDRVACHTWSVTRVSIGRLRRQSSLIQPAGQRTGRSCSVATVRAPDRPRG